MTTAPATVPMRQGTTYGANGMLKTEDAKLLSTLRLGESWLAQYQQQKKKKHNKQQEENMGQVAPCFLLAL